MQSLTDFYGEPISVYTREQAIADMDVLVVLACGCEEIWHDPFDLHESVYAWCEQHEDTTVAEITTRWGVM